MTRPKYILKHVVLISIFILVVLKLTGAGLREQEKEEIKIIVFVIATRIVSQGSLKKSSKISDFVTKGRVGLDPKTYF